jgi:hypothetical protein
MRRGDLEKGRPVEQFKRYGAAAASQAAVTLQPFIASTVLPSTVVLGVAISQLGAGARACSGELSEREHA